MKSIPLELVGKRLKGLVLREADDPARTPRSQLFLLFDDGTSFEFWCGEDAIHPAGGVDDLTLDKLGHYMGDVMRVVRQVPPKPPK